MGYIKNIIDDINKLVVSNDIEHKIYVREILLSLAVKYKGILKIFMGVPLYFDYAHKIRICREILDELYSDMSPDKYKLALKLSKYFSAKYLDSSITYFNMLWKLGKDAISKAINNNIEGRRTIKSIYLMSAAPSIYEPDIVVGQENKHYIHTAVCSVFGEYIPIETAMGIYRNICCGNANNILRFHGWFKLIELLSNALSLSEALDKSNYILNYGVENTGAIYEYLNKAVGRLSMYKFRGLVDLICYRKLYVELIPMAYELMDIMNDVGYIAACISSYRDGFDENTKYILNTLRTDNDRTYEMYFLFDDIFTEYEEQQK